MNFTGEESLIKIKDFLDTKFGKGVWAPFEIETLSLELGYVFSKLLVDKISLLRVFEAAPLQVYEDPTLFLYAAEAINNHGADFSIVPHLTILEAAYTVYVFDKLLKSSNLAYEYPVGLKAACTYVLNHEGASVNVYPFSFVDPDDLVKGQTAEDTANKETAIKAYIKHMESL